MEELKNKILQRRINAAIDLIKAYKRNDCDNEIIKYYTIECCSDNVQQEIILNLLEQEEAYELC
tara:strand:+ start:5601 stop:5792 length:192 start_codon:yes stop_codon:yes gene_type:complete